MSYTLRRLHCCSLRDDYCTTECFVVVVLLCCVVSCFIVLCCVVFVFDDGKARLMFHNCALVTSMHFRRLTHSHEYEL